MGCCGGLVDSSSSGYTSLHRPRHGGKNIVVCALKDIPSSYPAKIGSERASEALQASGQSYRFKGVTGRSRGVSGCWCVGDPSGCKVNIVFINIITNVIPFLFDCSNTSSASAKERIKNCATLNTS